jgi:hypothetical protein
MKDWDKYLDLAFKAAVPVGVVIMLMLQANFVTRSEFLVLSDKMSDRISKIEQVLIRMEATAETDRRQDTLLADHENRLRAIEKN